MTKIQKIISLAAAFALMLGLSACGTALTDDANIPASQIREFTLTLEDGSVVPCIKIELVHGIDCNWNKVTRPSVLPKP